MHNANGRGAGNVWSRAGWWFLAVTCAFYGAFALQAGVAELLFVAGMSPEGKHRATPLVFIVHALAGAVALFAGPLQLNTVIRRRARLHRGLGRLYVVAVWIAGVTALLDVRRFGVSALAKGVLGLVAILWIATTAAGLHRARLRRIAEHREWMLRSFSLSFFFVTFSVWVPALAATPLPAGISYPLALFLSGAINLAVAEYWIRRTRRAVPVLVEREGQAVAA